MQKERFEGKKEIALQNMQLHKIPSPSENKFFTYPVLKEVWIQVLVKPLLESHTRFLPLYLICEGNLDAFLQLHLHFTGQVDINYLVVVEAYV